MWGKNAENCANFIGKGRLVCVEGSLQNNNYEDKNGTKHYNVEINASKVEFLDYKDDNQKQAPKKQESNNEFNQFQDDNSDGCPF